MTTARRASRGHTHDPWPCCGTVARQEHGRPKGGICDDCQRLVRLGKATLTRQDKAGERTCRWAERSHDWAQYYGDYEFTKHDTGEELARAMYELANTLTTPLEQNAPWRSEGIEKLLDCEGSPTRYDEYVLVSVDPAVRDRLNVLDAKLRRALESAHQAGKNEGQSILRQLASGDMSVNDFTKRTTG